MWGAVWTFCHEDNCSASRCLPSDAEQLTKWRNFQFAPKNHYGFFFLHTLPSTVAVRLEYVLFYQFYAIITTFVDQKKFGMAPLLYVDIKKFGGNWRENNVKTSKMTSKHQNRYTDVLHENLLHPSCETTFPCPGRVHGNPGRVCKKMKSWYMYIKAFYHFHLVWENCSVRPRDWCHKGSQAEQKTKSFSRTLLLIPPWNCQNYLLPQVLQKQFSNA